MDTETALKQNTISLERYEHIVEKTTPVRLHGRVTHLVGTIIESLGPDVSIGDLCYIASKGGLLPSEVVGFKENKVLLMPLGEMKGISPGSEVFSASKPLSVNVCDGLLGRVVDGLGNPIDGKGPLVKTAERSIYQAPPLSITRPRITEPVGLGIRAIDSVLTVGKGQKLGIFAGSGVGKSVLMGMIAKRSDADINVVILLGERGREVREFIERDLGEEGLKRSVVVVVTSDQAPLLKIKGALSGFAIAEYFRDQGRDVVLLMDSLTRVAMAQREIGLAVGEPPTAKGYTPSVFALLPSLLERAGTAPVGSITALATVLVEADDFNEPISDAARSILDGHIMLSRALAAKNHYPAIDVMDSISRIMKDISSKEHIQAAGILRSILATYKEAEDLINIGAYVRGSNPQIDKAIAKIDIINKFLQQGIDEEAPMEKTISVLQKIVFS